MKQYFNPPFKRTDNFLFVIDFLALVFEKIAEVCKEQLSFVIVFLKYRFQQ